MDGPSAAVLVAVRRRAIRLEQGMDTNSCVHHMLDKAGLSPNAACQSMGRANGYVDQSLKRRGGIGAPTLAEIAQACGYELQLVGRGETLRIDPAPASEAENTQKTPRKGSFPLFGNPSVTWDPFRDGQELLAITEPYESPTFYHVGQHEDGSWHVLSVEKHDYAQEGEESLEAQLARVRKMRRLQPGDEGRGEVIDSLLHYVYDESPEAKAKAEERWKRNQAEAVRILAEAKTQSTRSPRGHPSSASPARRGPSSSRGSSSRSGETSNARKTLPYVLLAKTTRDAQAPRAATLSFGGKLGTDRLPYSASFATIAAERASICSSAPSSTAEVTCTSGSSTSMPFMRWMASSMSEPACGAHEPL